MNRLNRIKKWLYGPSFAQLMEREKTNKYRIAKGSGISYQTLLNWEAGRCKPTSRSAKVVGYYLGLISSDEYMAELKREAADIKAKLERLK